jgi:FAD/FMN-containing dehydrogenase
MSKVSRRGLLKSIVAGAIVLGFDPAKRSWVTEARADTSSPFAGLPPLDGTLSSDPTVIASHADDFGHIVHRTPIAVLLPGSVDDIVKVVKFCRSHNIKVATRGRGHTAFGQSQVDAGVSIDLGPLNEIHSITRHHAVVDAGVVWRDLLLATTEAGLTPPVLTDYINLTVGGTLSVGGINGRSYIHGAEVDNVLELDIVTGEGELVHCSRSQNSKLFDVALGGLGMCGIIVRAKLKLIKAEEQARTHRFFYADIPTMMADLRYLAHEKRFDHLRGNGQPTESGWMYYIEGTSFHTPDADDDDDAGDDDDDDGERANRGLPANPFAGLHFLPGSQQIEDRTYFEYCDQVDQLIDFLNMIGLGGLPHPWLDLFVPGSKIDSFATSTMANLNPAEFLPGSIMLIFPFKKSKVHAPMFRVPDEETFFLFDILQTAAPVQAAVEAALARNRALYDQNVAQGGTHYVISAVRLDSQDWQQHFGPMWGKLVSAKNKYDPASILAAGVSVFG